MLLKGTTPLFRQLQNSGELKKSSFISILVLEAGHILRIKITRPFYVLYEIWDMWRDFQKSSNFGGGAYNFRTVIKYLYL